MKNMKALFLNGSPRNNGTIAKMLQEIQKNLLPEIQTEWINVEQLNFASCKGCMACREKHCCILQKDDAHIVAEKIKSADFLIVGSPCYWGNMNGKMKMLFDRMVYALMDEGRLGIPIPLQKGKKAVVATCCTTPFPFNILAKQSQGTFLAIKEILKYSGYRIVGKIQKGGTKQNPKLKKLESRRLKSIAKKLK